MHDHRTDTATANSRQVVTFTVADEEYAVPILSVREIIRRVETTSIPCSGPGIEGIINLRGSIIPVVRMADRLGLHSEVSTSEDQRILVLDIGRSQVGFLVDCVKQVLRVEESRVSPAPRVSQHNAEVLDAVAKLDDRLVLLVDPNKLTNEDINVAAEFAASQADTASSPTAQAA